MLTFLQVLQFRYSAKYVKEYIEGAKPIFSVGEYWDSCNYHGTGLDHNQGNIPSPSDALLDDASVNYLRV